MLTATKSTYNRAQFNARRFKAKPSTRNYSFSLLELASANPSNNLSNKQAAKVKNSFDRRIKRETKKEDYKTITAFKDRQGNVIEKSLAFEPCKLPWSTEWASFKVSKAQRNALNSQVNRRIEEGEADYRAVERAEPQSVGIIRKKLMKGISGEFAFYNTAEKLQFDKTDVLQPRDDGPSWFGDIIFFDGSYCELKTTEGEFIPGQYESLLGLPIQKKIRQYAKNSPGYAFNVADKYGNVTREHSCKTVRKASFTNEFFVGMRHKVERKGNRNVHSYKISVIARMVDLERRVEHEGQMVDLWDLITKPWDDERENMVGFCNGKARLIEELMIKYFIKYDIPFYKIADNRYNSNAPAPATSPATSLSPKKGKEAHSPTGVKDLEKLSNSAFGCLYESDED